MSNNFRQLAGYRDLIQRVTWGHNYKEVPVANKK